MAGVVKATIMKQGVLATPAVLDHTRLAEHTNLGERAAQLNPDASVTNRDRENSRCSTDNSP